nr:carboxypeptidase-like regulatory domain-containing protein [Haliscomenobacter sp.]
MESEPMLVKAINGTVLDETNSPLPGVSILVKGTTNGAVTDINGQFSLEVPDEATLVFSYTGYRFTRNCSRCSKRQLPSPLKRTQKLLDGVVVIGYGTAKKSDLTGSVGSVKVDQLQERPSASLTQALSGRIAGAGKQQLGPSRW